MSFTIFDQVHILVLSAFFGCISCIVFLVYESLYRKVRSSFFRFFCDIVISAFYSVLYFLFVIMICRGRISVFQLLFFIIGIQLTKEISVHTWDKMTKIGKRLKK